MAAKKLNPFTVLIDTREQTPWVFDNTETLSATLSTGDYTIKGLESRICIERKSLADFIGCCNNKSSRERFEAELIRMRGYDYSCVIIEAGLHNIKDHNYRSQMHPNAVIGTMAAWSTRHKIMFFLADDKDFAARYALSLMSNYHKQLASLCKVLGL